MSKNLESRPYTSWQLLKTYWQSKEKFFAYSVLFFVLLMTMTIVGFSVLLNYWYNYFYNALQAYDKQSVLDLIVIFMFIVAVLIVIQVYRYYLQAYLGLRWRRWLTNQFLDRWLQNKSYFYLENFDQATDNPDQRIQEDIGSLVTYSLSLLVGAVSSIATFFAFIYVLWSLSGVITIPLGSLGSIQIPGYLAWVGVIYAAIGTYFTFKIGKPLVLLNFEQQRREADFRFAAVDLRTHGENVALYRGEHHQKTILSGLVDKFLDNWYMIILRQKLLLWFTAGYNQLSVIVPLVVALPNYFSRVFELGGLIQTIRAFDSVQEALSFLVTSFTTIAEWRAVLRRLITFLNHMYEVEESALHENHFNFHKQKENAIIVRNVCITTPRHEKLLENINETFIHRQHYLLKGTSGIGKSTFVRAIAQIWPFGSGEITLPENKHIMYLPQKPYMPIGTLEQALLFPDQIHTLSRKELIKYLEMVHLGEFADRLGFASMWSQQFSPGEQQRIGFVRVLIHKPDWVFLDESTSSLDKEHEKYLYDLLKTELPHCSYVSVGHRSSLVEHHEHVIDMTKYSKEHLVV